MPLYTTAENVPLYARPQQPFHGLDPSPHGLPDSNQKHPKSVSSASIPSSRTGANGHSTKQLLSEKLLDLPGKCFIIHYLRTFALSQPEPSLTKPEISIHSKKPTVTILQWGNPEIPTTQSFPFTLVHLFTGFHPTNKTPNPLMSTRVRHLHPRTFGEAVRSPEFLSLCAHIRSFRRNWTSTHPCLVRQMSKFSTCTSLTSEIRYRPPCSIDFPTPLPHL